MFVVPLGRRDQADGAAAECRGRIDALPENEAGGSFWTALACWLCSLRVCRNRSRMAEGGRALKHAVEAVAVGRGRQVVRGRTFYRLSTWELKQSGEAAPARLADKQAGSRQAAGRDR